ncbi:transposase family protein [Streptomyces noursei]|uniref:transposase family protein n=1 Tax=Streptomyces noursei TaxID=1971 RepID=UPI0033CED559
MKSLTRQHRAIVGLEKRLRTLPDPRRRRGRRHSLVSVLLIAVCAVLAGARSYSAVGQWARHAPQEALARLGARAAGPFTLRQAPSTSTIRRVLLAVCPGGLADLLGRAPDEATTVAVDGNSARGSRTDTAPAAHLLAAVTGTGQTVTQLRVPDRNRP